MESQSKHFTSSWVLHIEIISVSDPRSLGLIIHFLM